MYMENLSSQLDLQTPFTVAARTASANGSGVDVSGYDGELLFNLQAGAVSGTTPTLDVKIQDSADNSTFADVAGATFTQITSGTSNQKLGVQSRAVRQFVRAVATIGGTSPSFTFGVSLMAQKRYQP